MTTSELKERLFELPPKEQLEIQEELWQRLQPNVELRLTPELRAVLEARLEEAKANPDAGISWEEASARIKRRLAERRA